jgi:hypothetical protein
MFVLIHWKRISKNQLITNIKETKYGKLFDELFGAFDLDNVG